MIEKLNDYFLNLLNNPTFGAEDFTLVGLSVDNTSLLDKNTYLNSNVIKNLEAFKTNGEFDLSKFDNFYDYAKKGFLDLAKLKEADDLGTTWMAYRNDISMPEYLRDNRPLFKVEKVANPLRQQSGFVSFGLKEMPTKSIRENAETQLTYDYDKKQWKESPNETFWDNLLNPKVLATWDFDADENGNPTNDPNKIVYHKGERKLNQNGTYYYETLGNRNVYGKEVLSAFDTITTDGSKWNKLDFLDSDDIEKSTKGSLMRAVAQIVPAFIPGVNSWYIGARVGLGLAQVLPAVGKTLESFAGIKTENSLFNKLEAWDKALSFSSSDYVLGSLTDDGLVLSDPHLWSMETGFKLIADVFTQLAEQRWLFEKSTSWLSGLDKEIVSSKEAQAKWIENYIAKNSKELNLEDILKGISKGVDPRVQLLTALNVNWLRALKVLEEKLKGAQELGSKLSMAYMTGITTAGAYGEAKEAGATDVEAALFTLGYTFGEYKLLSSELGQWILPELKSEVRHAENVVSRAMPRIKAVTNNADTSTELGKATWYLKLFDLGKKAYENRLGDEIISETIGSTVSNMTSEALEETAEELLLDFAKTIFNIGATLGSGAKFEDNFENVFDRYALSFLGGAVGGGIAGYLPAYRSARFDRGMSQLAATKEIVDFVQQGKEDMLLNAASKMTFGNKYLDEQGNQVDDYTKSLDYLIKLNFARLIQDVKDILTVNGANLDLDSLLRELGPRDIRYGMLSALATEKSNSIEYYLNKYNDLSSELVSLSLELKGLNSNKTDEQQRKEETDERETELKRRIEEVKKELDKFKDGTMSDEFILDALFEMTSKISGEYIVTPERWIEEKAKKPISELSKAELDSLTEEFLNSKPLRRDLVHLGRLVHIKNMEWLSKMLTEYNENYFKNQDEAIANFNEVIFGHRNAVIQNPDNAVPMVEQYLAQYKDRINPLLYNFLQVILASMDSERAKNTLEKLNQIVNTPTRIAKIAGLDTLPTTAELLRSLTDELKKKLLGALGVDDFSDIEGIIDDYIEGESLKSSFNLDINKAENTLRLDLTQQFNELLIEFLSNKEVKESIINRLKSAKYILPTVRQALTDFFTANIEAPLYDLNGLPIFNDETGEQEIGGLNKRDVQEYLDSFKDVPGSPIDLYLNNVVTTLRSKGIEVSPLVSDINTLISKLSIAKNLESFSYDEDIEKTIDEALKIIRYAKLGLDSAATTINGDLSDAYGFNVTVNEIRSKRGTKQEKLAEIPSDIAEGIKLDLSRYESDLLLFKSLLAYNSNSILNEHDKTYKLQTINLYKQALDFIKHLDAPDWEDINKLKEELESGELAELLDDEESINLDYKDKLTRLRLKIDKAFYNFFKANENKLRGFKSKESKESAIKQILTLIKDIKPVYSSTGDGHTSINLEEKSMPEKDFLWYLASMAAADPESIMKLYSDVISADYAPIIGQEEAIRTSLSFLIDPKVFKLFADAYNLNLIDDPSIDTKYGKRASTVRGSLYINAYRSIFIEGVPGSGKSSATLKTLTDILDKYHPKLLEKLVIVSNSKENSSRLVETLGMDPSKIQHFGIEEFRSKIMNNYKRYETDKFGALNLSESDVEFKDGGYKYKNFSLNSEGIDASFIIVDEATSLSLMDAEMLDSFLEAKDIYGVYAGDFDQLGASGKFTRSNGTSISITLQATNYISTHKLGQVLRGNNSYKTSNTISLKINKELFIDSFLLGGRTVPINFSYYSDSTGVYGDIVAKADFLAGADGRVAILDLGTKDIIDNMINSLRDGEKINYIYDDTNSEMYKYLHENFPDKVNELSTKAAQSLEGQYYIVDINIRDGISRDVAEGGIIKATNLFKTLYTALSRAKLATLIYDRGSNNGTISDRLNSIRMDKLIVTNIGQEARKNYADSRKTSIKRSIDDSVEVGKFNWNKETFEKKENSITSEEEPEDDSTGEETYDEQTDLRNAPKEVDIVNTSNDSLNMMIHSFNTHESGGIIDENGQLVLGEGHEDRIDNAHGIVKALGIQVTNGKLSKEDTDRVLTILHKTRTAGLYEKSNGDVVSKIIDAFDLNTSSNVTVNFIYKNSQAPDTLTSTGNMRKFFKSVKDKLMYLFSNNKDQAVLDKLETPPNRTIGLEIFIDGKQIDIPIGTFTSPITLLQTKGFEDLKSIYTLSGENLISFEKELKRRKLSGQNIPHLDSMLKFLEIYQWNYNNKTGNLNFVVRFDKDFVLNSDSAKITGVQTPPTLRGLSYVDTDYLYKGERISLDEYRRRMSNRKISSIYENLGEDIKDLNGNMALEHGIPFVLVSDYYSELNDHLLYLQYIKQITEGTEPLITRVYVYLPNESIDYFLYNLLEAIKLKGSNDLTQAKDLDSSIGNKLTTYRLLSFMLKNENTNFYKAFKDFIENGNFTEDAKQHSLSRLERLKGIIDYVTRYEQTLNPSSSEGSRSKQILNFLELPVNSLGTEHATLRELIFGKNGDKVIGNTNWSLRTIFLSEFRKLLFTGTYYEDSNASPGLLNQVHEITKDGDNYKYQDFLLTRIEALKQDAIDNNWKGIMFHSALIKESEIVANKGGKSYKVALINASEASFISSKSIDVNGKLDSTAVITNVEPILDEILSKLVVTADGSVCSDILKGKSQGARSKLWRENTGAYLNKVENKASTISKSELILTEAISLLDSDSVNNEYIQWLKDYLDNDDDPTITPRNLLNILGKPNRAVILNGNKVKIVELGENAEILADLGNAVYFIKDGIILKTSGLAKIEVNNPAELLTLLDNNTGLIRGARLIIELYINKLNTLVNTVSGEELLNSIFGEGIDFDDLLNYKTNSSVLLLAKAILINSNGQTEYNPLVYLTTYLLSIKDKAAWRTFIKNQKINSLSEQEIRTILENYIQDNTQLDTLLSTLKQSLELDANNCTRIDS